MPLLTQTTLKQAPASGSGTAFYAGIFGDGSDGSASLDGTATVAWATKSGSTYTMSRDAHTTSLNIAAGVTLIPSSNKVFCQGTVSNAGTISANGNDGSATGTGGAALGNGTLGGSAVGGAGNTGAGSAGAGTNARIGVGAGGASGAGSAGASANGGFAGSGTSAPYRNPTMLLASVTGSAGSPTVTNGAPSGGGGGGDGTNKGGGGGSGAGIMAVFARTVVNSGTLNAKGGAGGTPATGNCGGGGGGGGGVILIYTISAATGLPNAATACTGGAAGAGVGTGATGVAGGAGTITNVLLA